MREGLTWRQLMGIMLKHWRMLLACILTLAILIGLLQTIRLRGMYVNSSAMGTIESDQSNLRNYMFKKEALEHRKEDLLEHLAWTNNYLSNSLLLQADSLFEKKNTLSFCIELTGEISAEEYSTRYQNIMECYTVLAADCSIQTLLSDTKLGEHDEFFIKEVIKIDDSKQGIITLEAMETDSIPGSTIIERLYSYLETKQSDISDIAGEHRLCIVSNGQKEYNNWDVFNKRVEYLQQGERLESEIKDIEKQIKTLHPPAIAGSISKMDILKSAIKYAILGGFVGACLGAIYIFVKETARQRFYSGASVARTLHCRYLGNLLTLQEKRGLDALAEKLYGIDLFSLLSKDENINILVANIREAVEGKRSILITGTKPESELHALTEKIASGLGEHYKVEIGANLLVNAASVHKLTDAEGIVLVVDAKNARIDYVALEAMRIQESKKELLGIIWA